MRGSGPVDLNLEEHLFSMCFLLFRRREYHRIGFTEIFSREIEFHRTVCWKY
jgi:hypothetical protein